MKSDDKRKKPVVQRRNSEFQMNFYPEMASVGKKVLQEGLQAVGRILYIASMCPFDWGNSVCKHMEHTQFTPLVLALSASSVLFRPQKNKKLL